MIGPHGEDPLLDGPAFSSPVFSAEQSRRLPGHMNRHRVPQVHGSQGSKKSLWRGTRNESDVEARRRSAAVRLPGTRNARPWVRRIFPLPAPDTSRAEPSEAERERGRERNIRCVCESSARRRHVSRICACCPSQPTAAYAVATARPPTHAAVSRSR